MSKYLQLITVELSKQLCDIFIAEGDQTFVSMQDLYGYYFPRLETNGVAKVRLCFERTGSSRQFRIEQLADVTTVPAEFNPDSVLRHHGLERRRIVTEIIHLAMSRAFAHYGWDMSIHSHALNAVVARGFKADELWKKAVWRKDKAVSAQARWRYEEDISLEFQVRGEIQRDVVLTILPPGIGALWELLGTVEWPDEHTVLLRGTNKRDYWSYDIPTNKVEFIYGPAARGDPKGEYDLAMMYLNGRIVRKNQDAAIHWLSRAASRGFERAKRQLAVLKDKF